MLNTESEQNCNKLLIPLAMIFHTIFLQKIEVKVALNYFNLFYLTFLKTVFIGKRGGYVI